MNLKKCRIATNQIFSGQAPNFFLIYVMKPSFFSGCHPGWIQGGKSTHLFNGCRLKGRLFVKKANQEDTLISLCFRDLCFKLWFLQTFQSARFSLIKSSSYFFSFIIQSPIGVWFPIYSFTEIKSVTISQKGSSM